MNTFRFRNFDIYQDAKLFRKVIRKLLKRFPKEEQYRLIDQIDRASLSIILNIAEGSAKNSDREFVRFLGISIASVSEVVAGFDIALSDEVISDSDFKEIERFAESIAKRIGGFMRKIREQNS